MAKQYAICCPQCGNYNIAKTGFFSNLFGKTTCVRCKQKISIAEGRKKEVTCEHCDNVVIYDLAHESPECPICHKPLGRQEMITQILCPSCGMGLDVERSKDSHTCPHCQERIDLKVLFMKQQTIKKGQISKISFTGDNVILIWKHVNEDFPAGSVLNVHESQTAIFFKDGRALDEFPSGLNTLDAKIMPMMATAYGVPEDTPDFSFSSAVYFISQTAYRGIKWGVPRKILLTDPVTKNQIGIGVRGTYSLRITNPRRALVELVGTADGLLATRPLDNPVPAKVQGRSTDRLPVFSEKFEDLILNVVTSSLPDIIVQAQIDLYDIDARKADLSSYLGRAINEKLSMYGVFLPEFEISGITTPGSNPQDPGYAVYMARKKALQDEYIHGLERDRQNRQTREAFEDRSAGWDMERMDAERRAEIDAIRARSTREINEIGARSRLDEAVIDDTILRMQTNTTADAYQKFSKVEADEMRQKGYTWQEQKYNEFELKRLDKYADLKQKEQIVDLLRPNRPSDSPISAQSSVWSCTCGEARISDGMERCPRCGRTRPTNRVWFCYSCNTPGLTTRFCPRCSKLNPFEAETAAGWNCCCGATAMTGDFCSRCGRRRTDPRNGAGN